MDITFVPRTESTVLDKRRPIDAALRKLLPGQIIVVCPATKTTRHTFGARAREIGIRIETAIDGDRLEIGLIAGRDNDADPKLPKGQLKDIVLACIRAHDGIRQVDIATECGITLMQAINTVKRLTGFGNIQRDGKLWKVKV